MLTNPVFVAFCCLTTCFAIFIFHANALRCVLHLLQCAAIATWQCAKPDACVLRVYACRICSSTSVMPLRAPAPQHKGCENRFARCSNFIFHRHRRLDVPVALAVNIVIAIDRRILCNFTCDSLSLYLSPYVRTVRTGSLFQRRSRRKKPQRESERGRKERMRKKNLSVSRLFTATSYIANVKHRSKMSVTQVVRILAFACAIRFIYT